MAVARTFPICKILTIFLIMTLGNDMMASAIVFKRCELARELHFLNFTRSHLPDWVCAVENESGRNTSAVGGPNSNGSYDYGIFQINGKYWCGEGKDCGIPCSALIDDDITNDAKCALKIYARHGFTAWHGWTKRCKDAPKPDLQNCFSTKNEEEN